MKQSLVDHFFELGKAGEEHADQSWRKLGLDTNKRTAIGVALQALLVVIDQAVEELDAEEVHGVININDGYVTFTIPENSLIDSIEGFQMAIAAS